MPPHDITIPNGLCQCGCGGHTSVIAQDRPEHGRRKGEHSRFLPNHHRGTEIRYRINRITGCWIWTGRRDRNGYGRISHAGKLNQLAHQLLYEQRYGPVPDGKELDHVCRNPSCVNPEHVEPVTHATNCQRSKTVKLTWKNVDEIRTLCGTAFLREIGDQFGVSLSTIHLICAGKTWVRHDNNSTKSVSSPSSEHNITRAT